MGATSDYLFPNRNDPRKHITENTMRQAINRMGFQATAHGLRATGSTILNETGFNPDAVERQLSHEEKNEVRRAYNRTKYWDERVKMMQQWADYLDGLKNGADVVPIREKS